MRFVVVFSCFNTCDNCVAHDMQCAMFKKLDNQPCYRVSEEVISETKKCMKGLSCLTGLNEGLCQVDYCVDGKVHFIKCLDVKHCPYKASFGGGWICHCPTRKEIYNKHGV